jgi:hypothetical protein
MSKKSKQRKVSAENGDMGAMETAVSVPVITTANTKTSYVQSFNPDYSDVKKDLKRIAILASSFFVVLIVLSFILH